MGVSKLDVPYLGAGECIDRVDTRIRGAVVCQVGLGIDRYRGANTGELLWNSLEAPQFLAGAQIEGVEVVAVGYIGHTIYDRWGRFKRRERAIGPTLAQLGHICRQDASLGVHSRSI